MKNWWPCRREFTSTQSEESLQIITKLFLLITFILRRNISILIGVVSSKMTPPQCTGLWKFYCGQYSKAIANCICTELFTAIIKTPTEELLVEPY